jgi:hypothetical protein
MLVICNRNFISLARIKPFLFTLLCMFSHSNIYENKKKYVPLFLSLSSRPLPWLHAHPHPNRKSETTLRVGRRGRVRPTSAWIRSKSRIDGWRAVHAPHRTAAAPPYPPPPPALFSPASPQPLPRAAPAAPPLLPSTRLQIFSLFSRQNHTPPPSLSISPSPVRGCSEGPCRRRR